MWYVCAREGVVACVSIWICVAGMCMQVYLCMYVRPCACECVTCVFARVCTYVSACVRTSVHICVHVWWIYAHALCTRVFLGMCPACTPTRATTTLPSQRKDAYTYLAVCCKDFVPENSENRTRCTDIFADLDPDNSENQTRCTHIFGSLLYRFGSRNLRESN